MKRYGDLWDEVVSFENLTKAFYKARKGKSRTPEAAEYLLHLEEYIFSLQEELCHSSYKAGAYRVFTIFEPKERVIAAVPFKDRVVHHAVCNVIEPLFDKGFIDDSFACRKNKGNHAGYYRLRYKIRKHFRSRGYVLKCDIRKYFPSVDHGILKEIIRGKIKDKRLLSLIDEIIDSSHSDFGVDKGIPIGNLTSQLFANIYLNELDQYVKHEPGVRHYLRYVDDFLLLSDSKEELHAQKHRIRVFLRSLDLSLHKHKANISLIIDGVDYVGYRTYPTHTRIRKSNIKKFVRRTRKYLRNIQKQKLAASTQSFLGYAKHADAYKITAKLMSEIPR